MTGDTDRVGRWFTSTDPTPRSRTARESTASPTKTSNTPSATHSDRLPATGEFLIIAGDRASRLLEVVVLDDDPEEEPVIIHALPLRTRFQYHLR